MLHPYDFENYDGPVEEDKLGMRITTGTVTLRKDDKNMIGISIGGGAPFCPCIYIVQLFENSPATLDKTLESGDEITAIDSVSVKGKTKSDVAKLIQANKNDVVIHYNKLHADPKQGKTLDIILKKVKHRVVESLDSDVADAFGLSRAILCNDSLIKRLNDLNNTSSIFIQLMAHLKALLRGIYGMAKIHREFGEVFAAIGVKEPQAVASEVFSKFGENHRSLEKYGLQSLKKLKPMISDINTFLTKAIPDTKCTVKKYLDAKFEYLSYCLKIKEMDDEEHEFNVLHEPLYRVESGNYEYRLTLRCRQDARLRFAKMRQDVLVKIELLDNKHVQDVVKQLQLLINGMSKLNGDCFESMKDNDLFPIEIDINPKTFQYSANGLGLQANNEDEEYEEVNEVSLLGEESQTDFGIDNVDTNNREDDLLDVFK